MSTDKCKIILSRKGFDSSSGGIASPVIDDKFFSLPIPEGGSGLSFDKLKVFGGNYSVLQLIRDLGSKKEFTECHMDPNLCPELYGLDETDGWSPAFGQEGGALTHLLTTNNVQPHAVFLFFGRFREAKLHQGKYEFCDKPDFHAIYGFMEVGEILLINKDKKCILTQDQQKKYGNHPHVTNTVTNRENSTLFIPATESKHGFKKTYGVFNFSEQLILTDTESRSSISHWKMDHAFWNTNFTYKLTINGDGTGQSPGRGQELVGDATTDSLAWIKEMIELYS